MTNYRLQNISNGVVFEDSGWLLSDPNYSNPSLIRAIYEKREIDFKDNSLGIFKYEDWLPINKRLVGSSATVTYKSINLSKRLNLPNLYISFSGYWPEIGANMTTCSFKETEAYSVCARLNCSDKRVMVVASAGNTARAFAKVCSDNNIPLLIVVPYDNMEALWSDNIINKCVKLVATPSGTDYFDAIDLANRIVANGEHYFEEGGAKNVARRDGMGTTVLSATHFIGEIPDLYFQAIGSGTGAIAAWEANLRLIDDGRFGKKKMKLVPTQNIPFTPMFDAWNKKSRDIVFLCEERAREQALQIDAKVLSNRKPPYSIPGGLYDALCDTNGEIRAVTNDQLKMACDIFMETEGVDIHPAAGAALAGMIDYFDDNPLERESIIMLNITGGGEQRVKRDKKIYKIEPSLVIDCNIDNCKLIEDIDNLFIVK